METSYRMDRIATRVALFALQGQVEDTVFDSAFSVLRQKSRDFKEDLEQKAKESLQNKLINDLKGRGYEDAVVEISLGKYRGSRFVTSAKVRVKVKDAREAKALVKVLQQYHSRYSLKEIDESGIASYNIR